MKDQADRNDAVAQPGTSMMLEAGAGTGKTTTMVNRLIEAVRQGQPIQNQVAISFTVKASWELLGRLRKELLTTKDPGCVDAVQHISSMRAGTIDSVVKRLLEENPLESGVAAGLSILSENEFSDRFEVWFRPKFSAWLNDESLSESWRGLDDMGVKLANKELLLRETAATAIRRGIPVHLLGVGLDSVQLLNKWKELLEAAENLVPAGGTLRDPALDNIQQLKESAKHLADDPFTDLGKLTALRTLGGAEGKECRDRIKQADAELRALAEVLRFGVVAPLLQQVANDAYAFVKDLQRKGFVTFDRCLHLAVELLDKHPEALKRVRNDIVSVMLDESQDTSPEQVRLVKLLGGEGPVFVVGDPKQSIYRFRGADLKGYIDWKNQLVEAKTRLGALSSNFRSQKPIVDLVNEVFRPVFSVEGGPGYQELHASAKQLDSGKPHAWIVGGLEASADDVRAKEAKTVIGALRLARSEGWKVSQKEGQPRSMKLSDVVVLYRARTKLRNFCDQLSAAGIPYRIEGDSEVLDTDEARSVINLLYAVTRTQEDEQAVREIATRAALQSLALNTPLAEKEAKVERQRLAQLALDVSKMTPSRAVQYVIAAFELETLAGLQPRPRSVMNRLHSLVDRAMSAEQVGIRTVREFADLIRAESGVRFNESPSPEPDEDAVRLMTVHSAKGLEFPFVIVLGFAGDGTRSENLHFAEGGELMVRVKGEQMEAQPTGFDERAKQEREEDKAENQRLLYVAMTRAEDHLIVSAYHHNRSPVLIQTLAGRSLPDLPWANLDDTAQVNAQRESLDFPDTFELLEAWGKVEQRERRTTPTRIAKSVDDEAGPEADLESTPIVELEPEYRSPAAKSGTAFGRAVHMVLQLVDLDDPQLEDLSKNAAALFGVSKDRVLLCAQRALASRVLQDRPAGGTVWREVYAATMRECDDQELLEGIVDLLYEMEDGSLVVVDYKTDKVSSEAEALKRMEQGYRLQAEAYRELIEGATGRKVSIVNFVFLNVEPAVVCSDRAE